MNAHKMLSRAGLTAALLLSTVQLAAAQADNYPSRPIRIIAPFTAGTSVDITARRLGDAMSPLLGQPIVVENKGGAGGAIGTDMVAKSPPDGYTLVLGTVGTHAFAVGLYKALPYDPLKDFAPITRAVVGGFNTLVVHPSFPANNMREFIAIAKEREQQGKPLTFGSAGVGSPGHLITELIKQATGIKAVHLPYKGSSLIVSDVVGGHVDFFIASPGIAVPQVTGKTLKAIAVDSLERSPFLPDVATLRESGVNNVEAQIWVGLLAPAGTPRPIIDKLHATALKVLATDTIKKDFDKDGLVIVTDPSPDAFGQQMAKDVERWTAVIRSAGIQAE
jgi:tripartite-type tricarboxylate transporter receptor subunit TctC